MPREPRVECPSLVQLLADLRRLEERGVIGQGAALAAGAGPVVRRSRDVDLVRWPGVGEFWLSGAQRAVVRLLAEALVSQCPEVSQEVLLRAAGSREPRLSRLFAGSPAWGALVLPGRRPGHFRLPEPPEVAQEEDERHEPLED